MSKTYDCDVMLCKCPSILRQRWPECKNKNIGIPGYRERAAILPYISAVLLYFWLGLALIQYRLMLSTPQSCGFGKAHLILFYSVTIPLSLVQCLKKFPYVL